MVWRPKLVETIKSVSELPDWFLERDYPRNLSDVEWFHEVSRRVELDLVFGESAARWDRGPDNVAVDVASRYFHAVDSFPLAMLLTDRFNRQPAPVKVVGQILWPRRVNLSVPSACSPVSGCTVINRTPAICSRIRRTTESMTSVQVNCGSHATKRQNLITHTSPSRVGRHGEHRVD